MQVIILLTVLTESPNIFIENHQKAKQSGVMSCVMLGVMLGPNLGRDNILAKLLIGLQFHEKNRNSIVYRCFSYCMMTNTFKSKSQISDGCSHKQGNMSG